MSRLALSFATAIAGMTASADTANAQPSPPPSPTASPTPQPTSSPTSSPTASPSPQYTLRYQPGMCETGSASTQNSATSNTSVCNVAQPTKSNPWVWNQHPWHPSGGNAPSCNGTCARTAPITYVSDDGYHWTLRPGRPS